MLYFSRMKYHPLTFGHFLISHEIKGYPHEPIERGLHLCGGLCCGGLALVFGAKLEVEKTSAEAVLLWSTVGWLVVCQRIFSLLLFFFLCFFYSDDQLVSI